MLGGTGAMGMNAFFYVVYGKVKGERIKIYSHG